MVTFETLPANVGRLMEEVDELKELVLEMRKRVSGEKGHVLVGVKEAAEILHKKPVTIYSLCRKGKLPHCKRDEGAKIYFYKFASRDELPPIPLVSARSLEAEARTELDVAPLLSFLLHPRCRSG